MSLIKEIQAAEVTPPLTNCIVAVNCTTSVQVVDMTTFPSAPYHGGNDPRQKNAVDKYIRITAQGGDVYFALSSNINAALAINTTSYTTVAANGKVTTTNAECDYIPAGSFKDIFISSATLPTGSAGPNTPMLPGTVQVNQGVNSIARYLGIVATANGTTSARIYQSSR